MDPNQAAALIFAAPFIALALVWIIAIGFSLHRDIGE